MELIEMTVRELSFALQRKECSSREVTESYLARIEKQEKTIGAFLTVCGNTAREQAEDVDRRRAAGETLSPLAGIPMALKDNLCTKGIRTTCASRMLERFVPPYDAAVYEKLRGAGAVLLGKTNLDEFAMGSSTENSAFQLTRNPVDPERVPGGSSGGSAAAVAALETPFALGSDTGGSIRQPAHFCGVVGLKPTYGTVSRYGLIAFASSLDQIGPLTRTVADASIVYRAICGQDLRDATSVPAPVQPARDVQGLQVALCEELLGDGITPAIKEAILQTARVLEDLGAIVDACSIPELSAALPAYYVLSSAEASSNLARFDGAQYGYRAKGCRTYRELCRKSRSEAFGPEVKRRILLGTHVLSAGYFDAYYKKAQRVRDFVTGGFQRAFAQYDLLLAPAAPTTAYAIGEKVQDPVSMYLGDVCTVPVSLAGLPALCMPCGRDNQNLPIGIQLIGPAFSEPLLLKVGETIETAVGRV